MSFSVTRADDVARVHVHGHLDAGNRRELRDAVLADLAAGARHFSIDLGSAGYIDSAGIGTLVSLSNQIRNHGGDLRLTNLNEELRTLFALTRLGVLFELGSREDDASHGVAAGESTATP